MGVFDSIKKIVSGDVAHDAADSGNPVKLGGKAASSAPGSIPTAVASADRVNAFFDLNGRLVTLPAAMYVADNLNGVTADTAGYLRMTQYRELVVAPNMVRAQYFSESVTPSPTDITVGVTSWYNTFVAASTAFFDADDAGFDANHRWIRIPMYRFARGATIGIFNNTGHAMGINIRAQITSYTTSNAANGPKIYTGSIANASYWYGSPLPLGDSVASGFVYIPQLNIPMEQLVIELTPDSDPSTGYFILTVAR